MANSDKKKKPTAKKSGKPTVKKAAPSLKAENKTIDWMEKAQEVSATRRWSVPWFVLMQEAATASAFVDKHWKRWRPVGKNTTAVPGLESVAKQLSAGVADDLRELQALAQAAQQEFLAHTRPKAGDDPRARANFVLGEITAALEFLFDDGVEDARDEQLAAVVHAHAEDGDSNAAVASALEDYAGLARAHRAELDGLGGFDVGVFKEVGALVNALRQPTPGSATPRSPEAIAALDRRNRLGNLIVERIVRVRSAARFVFRARPDIIREVTSSYLRRHRAAARRAAAKSTAPTA